MYKATYWIIWGLMLISVNLGAIPIAIFSLFATAEGTSIISVDYLLAAVILLVSNIISVQLFMAAKRQNQKYFLIGFVICLTQLTSFTLFMYVYITPSIILYTGSFLAAAYLLIKTFKLPKNT